MLHIHLLTGVPFCGRCRCGNVNVCEPAVHQGERFLDRHGPRCLKLLKTLFSSINKEDFPTGTLAAIESAFVNQVMMVSAQQDEVFEARFTTI